MNPPLHILFLGGRQAGCVGLLAAMSAGCQVIGVVAYDELVRRLASVLGLPWVPSIRQNGAESHFKAVDLVVSVHGREIVPRRLLDLSRLGGINVHPCLRQYKGARPIGRLLQDGGREASVGVHRMTEQVDEGEILAEEEVRLSNEQSEAEVYNTLYPLYASVLLKALRRVAEGS